jgi:hypothetical protein
MSQFRKIFVALFIIGFVLLLWQYLVVDQFYGKDFPITSIQLKNAATGFAMASAWAITFAGDHSLLYYARQNTWIDFIWIAGYAGVLINAAYYLMQREKDKTLNELLRLCFFLALLAGLLDLIENGILLFDFNHLVSAKQFYSSAYVSYPKWILSGIVVLIVAVSYVRDLVRR